MWCRLENYCSALLFSPANWDAGITHSISLPNEEVLLLFLCHFSSASSLCSCQVLEYIRLLIADVVDVEVNYLLERYGPGSLCFEHGSAWTVQHCNHTFPVEHWGSGCYQVLPPLLALLRETLSTDDTLKTTKCYRICFNWTWFSLFHPLIFHLWIMKIFVHRKCDRRQYIHEYTHKYNLQRNTAKYKIERNSTI